MNILDLILIIANAFFLLISALSNEDKEKLNKVANVLNFIGITLLAIAIFWRVNR